MNSSKTLACAALSAVMLIGTAGCFPPEVNDLVNGGMKLASGQIGALTAGELKALSDAAVVAISSETGQTSDPLTLEQAQAVVTFLDVNGIDTFDDLQTLAQQAEQDPDSVQGLGALAAAFGEEIANFDPSRLEYLFESTLGAGGPN